MANQYFENNKELSSNVRKINFYFREKKYELLTDNGVFSKNEVDFGSYTLLKTISFDKNKSLRILDVGCGYGPIGISIAGEYPNSIVDMIDVNERAIELAKINAKNNNVKNVNIFISNVYENIKEKYDYIITNPPIRAGKKIVHEIICGSINHLNENGELRCVIQQKQGAPSAIKALEETFGNVLVLDKSKGYMIISSKKDSFYLDK